MANKDSKFVENHEEYNAVFHIFARNRSDQQKVWIENDVVPKLQDVLSQAVPKPKSEFKILAVGSNAGSFDCLLIKALFSHAKELLQGKKVVYTVVEPNTAAIEDFKHNIASQDDIFQKVKFNWVNQHIEEFLEAKEPEQYDLVHFIHVLYYVENREEILKSVYETFLARPGCIVAAVASEKCIWVPLVESFKEKIPSVVLINNLTNIEISETCKRNGWAYETLDAKQDLEVTEVF